MRQKATFPRAAGSEAELLSIDLLEEHARRLAALLSVVPGGSLARRTHLRQLNGHMQALRDVYRQLGADSGQETLSPPAASLLANFHIVAPPAKDSHHDLPPSFFKTLPRVATDEFAGLPRIYALAIELIGSGAARIHSSQLA